MGWECCSISGVMQDLICAKNELIAETRRNRPATKPNKTKHTNAQISGSYSLNQQENSRDVALGNQKK